MAKKYSLITHIARELGEGFFWQTENWPTVIVSEGYYKSKSYALRMLRKFMRDHNFDWEEESNA